MRPTSRGWVGPTLFCLLFTAAMAAQVPTPAWAQAAPAHPSAAAAPKSLGRVEARVERRIAELHAKLRITKVESPEWDKFAGVMRDNARSMDMAFTRRAREFKTMSAMQNMESYTDIADQHAQDMHKLLAAFKPLYAVLSPAQKQAADQVFRGYAARHRKR